MTSGDVLLCDLNPVAGREQGGIRPVVVVSHHRYSIIPGLFLAVPLTSRDRGLAHHIEVPADDQTGLKQVSYAMTEQVRAMSDQRAGRQLGHVSNETLTTISRYLHLFIVLAARCEPRRAHCSRYSRYDLPSLAGCVCDDNPPRLQPQVRPPRW